MLWQALGRWGGGVGVAAGITDDTPATLPSYFASGAIDGLAGNGSLPTLALPASWQPGHLHILSIASRLGSTQVVNTAGWTLIDTAEPTDTAATDDRRMTLYYRVAQVGDSTVSVQQTAGGSHWSAQIHGFTDVNQTTPIEASSKVSDAGVALSFADLTTLGLNRLCVGFIGINGCSGYANSNLTSITERKDNIAAAGYGQAMFTGAKVSAGAIGATTASAANTDGYGLIMVALKPVGEGPVISYTSQNISSSATNSVLPTYASASSPVFTLVAGSLPSGMSLNSSTGEITGTAGANGTYSGIQIRVTAGGKSGTSPAFTLTAIAGYRYYFIEFVASTNNFLGCSTIKLLTGASVDRALQSNGGVATAIGYSPNGSFPVTNINDGNDSSFTTSAGANAGSGKGFLIDMLDIYDIDKVGFRSRSDAFGANEAITSGNVKGGMTSNTGSGFVQLYAISEAAWTSNEYREWTMP